MYGISKIEIFPKVGEERHLARYTSQPKMNAIETAIESITVVLYTELPRDSSIFSILEKTQEPDFKDKAMEIAKDIVSNMEIDYILPTWKEMKRTILSFGDVISYSFESGRKMEYILTNLNIQEIQNMVHEFEE
jgi:hypothetical protein